MAGEAISYDGDKDHRKTVSIEAYRIEASSSRLSSVSGNITLNIHCTGSPLGNKDVNSQLKVTGNNAAFTVSNGAVLVFTAENAVQTPFTNGKTLTVDGATITVLGNVTNTGIVGGTFTSDPGNTSACSTCFQNSSLLIANAFLVNKSQNVVTITGSTFEVGTWSGTGSNRTLARGVATNKGTITVEDDSVKSKGSIFRAGDVTNTGTITVTDSTFEAGDVTNNGGSNSKIKFSGSNCVAKVGVFTNTSGTSASANAGLVVENGASLTATGLVNDSGKLVNVSSGTFVIKNGETDADITNYGEIKVSGSGASLSAGNMDMSMGGTQKGVLTVTDGATATFSGLLGLNKGKVQRVITVTGGATLSAKKIVVSETDVSGDTPSLGGVIKVDAHSLVKVTGTGIEDTISGGTISLLTTGMETEGEHTYLVVYGKIDAGVKVSVDNGATQNYSAIDGADVGGPGYKLITQGGKGIWLTKEGLETLYVNSTYSATGDNDGHGYGYNAFGTVEAASVAATGDTSNISIVAGEYGTLNLSTAAAAITVESDGATLAGLTSTKAGQTITVNGPLTVNSNVNVSATLTTNDTFTVAGESTLEIGTLSGTITLAAGANIVDSTIIAVDSENVGTLNIASGNITFSGENTFASGITNSGTITIDAASSVTATSISGGTIVLSTGSVATVRTEADTLVSVTGTEASLNTVTLKVGDDTVSTYKKGVTINGNSYTLVKAAQSIYLTTQTQDTLYVGSEYDGDFGEIKAGHIIGYNAFSSIEAATDAGAGVNQIVIKDGTYEDITQLNGIKTTIEKTIDKNTIFSKAVYGGIKTTSETSAADGDHPVSRDIDLTVTGGSFSKLIVGGNNIAMETAETPYYVHGATQEFNISGGLFKSGVAAGDRFEQGDLHRTGDISMNISGGTFTYCVAGGMMNVAADQNKGHAVIEDNVETKITGGTFTDNCWLYGGGVSASKAKTASALSTIKGNVTITVDAAGVDANGIVLSHVAAGSHGYGHIDGYAKIVFLGDGDKDDAAVKFTENGELWGSSTGDVLIPSTKKIDASSVSGERILSFTGFNGQLGCANIRAFSKIELKKRTKDGNGNDLASAINSTVTLDKENENFNLSGVDTWDFDCGSTLSGSFINNLADDTLNLWGFSNITTQTLMTDMDNTDERNVFNGFIRSETCRGLAAIKMDGTPVSGLAFADNAYTFSAGNFSYKLSLETSGTSTSMVLAKL